MSESDDDEDIYQAKDTIEEQIDGTDSNQDEGEPDQSRENIMALMVGTDSKDINDSNKKFKISFNQV